MASGAGDGGGGGGGIQRERRHGSNKKTGAIKQIEAWARSGREMKVECGRNVGKLNDNVTEERMLQARIWELSRERYKFLSQAEYEKRTFLDRQLRKSAICREITKSMEGGKGGGAAEGGGEMKRALERRESVRSLSKGTSSVVKSPPSKEHAAGSALHLPAVRSRTKRGQLTAADAGKVDDDDADAEADAEPSFYGAHEAEHGFDKRRSRMFPTEPTHPVRYKSNLAMRQACGGAAHSAPVKRRISFAADSQNDDQSPLRRRDQRAIDAKPVDDPRYRLLERCLCEKWSRKGAFNAPEVAGVIRGNPSLYTPPKRGKDRKSSIAVKFLRMLSEQGWVF